MVNLEFPRLQNRRVAPGKRTWPAMLSMCLDYIYINIHEGYLSMVMTYSLCKVVLRRRYLKWYIPHCLPLSQPSLTRLRIMEYVLPSPDSQNLEHRKYWETMSHELFHEVVTLYEQIDAFMSQRSPDEGFPTEIVSKNPPFGMAREVDVSEVFFVYICGSLSCYLSKWPRCK